MYGIKPSRRGRRTPANGIGDHRGTRLFDLSQTDGGTGAPKVAAQGSWKTALKPVMAARKWGGSLAAGLGDDVLYRDPQSAGFQTIKSTFAGEGNSAVHGYDADGEPSPPANEIGSSKAEGTLPDGTFPVKIEGDGACASDVGRSTGPLWRRAREGRGL